MKEKFAKLIDVKSIVTLTLTIVLTVVILANIEVESNVFQLFSSALMLVLGFFFGKNQTRKEE